MSTLAPSENEMWAKAPRGTSPQLTDEEIGLKYAKRELRIVTEANREQLPNFVEALKRPGWMELRPFYQRRPRWDAAQQSKLIESFIMNVPVPPLFVYESDLAKYEVMDGQQRITAILDFYTNKLELKGLEQWPELNGRVYDTLPPEIKKGIDRRSISYIVLLKESASSSEDESLLRQEVFERLNTGGVRLSAQEVRNALYQGKFNRLLFDLVKNPIFRQTWGLPPYSESAENNRAKELTSNKMWVQMQDIEIALRFFALRHVEHFQRGMKGFLNLYMVRSRTFRDEDVAYLKSIFERTLELGSAIYGEFFLRPWEPDTETWSKRPQIAFADAVTVGLSRYLDSSAKLIQLRERIIESTKELVRAHPPGTFTGRANTKKDIQDRLDLYSQMLRDHVAE